MAKLQRWRRGRSAGEGTTATEEVVEVDDASAAPDDDAPGTDDTDPASTSLTATADDDAGTEEPDDDDDLGDDLDDDLEESADSASGPRRTGFFGWITRGTSPREWVVVTLLQAAHTKQAVATALAMGLAAVVSGRPARESGVIVLSVLTGQAILGWYNDITDKARDQRHATKGKPLADGRLETGTLWYAIIIAVLLLIPLAITTGITAGCIYLASVAIAMLGNVVLRTGILSFWSWAISYAMLPAYLSYGGWGGQAVGTAPQTAIVVLAALLGIGVHFMRAPWGLVADHEDGWTYLPLKLGLKVGATRLLALSTLYTTVIVALLVVFGLKDGLAR